MKRSDLVKKMIHENPFYEKFYAKQKEDFEAGLLDFTQLPILTKEHVQENYELLCKNTENIKVISSMTSGTTGMPMKVTWTLREYTKSNYYTWNLRKKWYHILPSDKFCTFHSTVDQNMSDITIENEGRTLSLGRYAYTEDVLEKYVEVIQEFEPVWILGQVSAVYSIGKYLHEKNITIESLRYIELNGEYVEDSMMECIKEYFHIPIGNLYGSTEFNGISFLCPFGNMHILENNVYVENRVSGNESELLVTGLVNTLMPLIRYNLGDIGLVEDEKTCQCGMCGKQLRIKQGRQKELLLIQNKNINADIFNNIVTTLNMEHIVVIRYCLVVEEEKCILQLLIKPEYLEYVKIQRPMLERKLSSFGLRYRIEIYTDLSQLMDADSKFTYVRHRK